MGSIPAGSTKKEQVILYGLFFFGYIIEKAAGIEGRRRERERTVCAERKSKRREMSELNSGHPLRVSRERCQSKAEKPARLVREAAIHSPADTRCLLGRARRVGAKSARNEQLSFGGSCNKLFKRRLQI